METTLIITVLVAAGSIISIVFTWLGRTSNPIMLFGLAGATVLAAFLAIISRTEGPVVFVAAIIMGLAGLALIGTPAALLLWDAYQTHRSKSLEKSNEPGVDESKA